MGETLYYREAPGLVVAGWPALVTVWAAPDLILGLVGSFGTTERLKALFVKPARINNAIQVRQLAQEISKTKNMEWVRQKISSSTMSNKDISEIIMHSSTSDFLITFLKRFGALLRKLLLLGSAKISLTNCKAKGLGDNDE